MPVPTEETINMLWRNKSMVEKYLCFWAFFDVIEDILHGYISHEDVMQYFKRHGIQDSAK